MAKPHSEWIVLPRGNWLQALCPLPNLQRVMISRGDIIAQAPRAALNRICAG